MSKTSRALSKIISLSITTAALTGMLSGCGESSTQSTGTKDSAKTAAAHARIAADPGLTLPVLDALFYEDGFEQELKTKLALSSTQISKLRATAHESVEELTEDGTGDYMGSARGAAKRSEEQIRKILGDEKADELFTLLAQRYSGGDVEGLMPTTPNAIPKDTRIVVNAPAYRMDLYQDGRLLKTYRVGIGYPEFPLPTGMRRAETIIFNPTWTPPDEAWVKGQFKPGEPVEAGSKLNPLGPIKIPIGAPSLIHGGKAPAKLGNFASHGCVGLTNELVQDFAVSIAGMAGSSLTTDSVKSFGRDKTKTRHYKLPNAVPVELRYETIVAENGGIRVYRDVYERGTNTVENLGRVLEVYGVKYTSLPAAEKQALLTALTEMNQDPHGNAIVANIGGGAPDMPDSTRGQDAPLEDRAKKGKETKTVKGRKEIAVPIAALAGRGYPAAIPVGPGKH